MATTMTSASATPRVANKTAPSPLASLSASLADDMAAVNATIMNQMQSDVALIPQLAGYLIAAGGKRIRPLLTLAATRLFDDKTASCHAMAAAVEFIHTATLLHDDVVDESDERRGQAAANAVFGNQASVLVGDFLFSRAFELMTANGSLDVLRILSRASSVIAEGEVLQLSIQNRMDVTFDQYKAVINAKTAALFAAATEIGPHLANKPAFAAQLQAYGHALGMVFQITDDVLDYKGDQAEIGKVVGDDFREGKLTAPVLLALAAADDEERVFWERTMGRRDQQDGDLAQAIALCEKHDSFAASLQLAEDYVWQAEDALSAVPPSDLRDMMLGLPRFVLERRS